MENQKNRSKESLFSTAVKKGWDGGTSGAAAMSLQVVTLMWLRTTVNYQYRYGTSTSEAMRELWLKGGVRRFYRGIAPALVQAPTSRFGDTAANQFVLTYLEEYDMHLAIKTCLASCASATWRILIMPVDTLKTTLQVEGRGGLSLLGDKLKQGPQVLWHGSLAAASATAVGHFPWFFTYNLLQSKLPKYEVGWQKLGREAGIGFTSSAISDTISNSFRVVKTTRQTFSTPISYAGVVRYILQAEGVRGIMFRGLVTKILANGIQGLMFSVLWKYFREWQTRNNKVT